MRGRTKLLTSAQRRERITSAAVLAPSAVAERRRCPARRGGRSVGHCPLERAALFAGVHAEPRTTLRKGPTTRAVSRPHRLRSRDRRYQSPVCERRSCSIRREMKPRRRKTGRRLQAAPRSKDPSAFQPLALQEPPRLSPRRTLPLSLFDVNWFDRFRQNGQPVVSCMQRGN
jgi:hypothetical protein